MVVRKRINSATLDQKIVYGAVVLGFAVSCIALFVLDVVSERLALVGTQEIGIKLVVVLVSCAVSYLYAKSVGKYLYVPAQEAFDRLIEEIIWQYDGLVQSKIKAEESNRMKSEFLANMSHELRTPLNSLLILSQELVENDGGNLSDQEVEDAGIIYKSGKDLLGLINDILDLSKIESGKMEVESAEMLVGDLLNDLRNGFAPVAQSKNLSFECTVIGAVPEVVVTDKVRLEQILRNFLSNAFKFTNEGGVKLKLFCSKSGGLPQGFKEEEGVVFTCSVEDTGIGISQDNIQEIFDAFKQADGSISRKYGGTGLGLSISERFARLLGGVIEVDSKEGRGSKFTLHVPVGILKGDTILSDVEEEDISGERGSTVKVVSDCGNNTILVIEDDESFVKILERKVRQYGCKCVVASDGMSGVKAAAEYNPRAIILDIGLSDVSGLEVQRLLKTDPATSDIPILFMTVCDAIPSFADEHSIGVLIKPVSPVDLDKAFESIAGVINGAVKHILIVEDDLVLRESISKMAKKRDLKIDEASSAKEALDILKNSSPDCMLLDIVLPDMSGIELLENMALDDCVSKPRVIVHSGKDLTPEEKAKIARYSDSYVGKNGRSVDEVFEALFVGKVKGSSYMKSKGGRVKREPSTKQEYSYSLDGKKVLVVDDNGRNIFVLSKILNKAGASVYTAQDGQEALNFLRGNSEKVDLVLMDVMMPVMDGLSAVREMRKDANLVGLPVISVTAKAMKDDVKDCVDAGADAYISKPIDKDDLFAVIDKVMQERNQNG